MYTMKPWSAFAPWLRLAGMVLARMVLAVVAGLTLWAVALVPFGHHATIIASGSMKPSIGVGDVAVMRELDADTDILGRVVTADDPAKPGRQLTHRVVYDYEDGTYQTKGDANRDPDHDPVSRDDIRGRGFILVPWVGLPAHWASTGQYVPLVLTVAGLSLLVVIARDPEVRSARHRPVPVGRLRLAGSAGLVVALLGASGALLPATLSRSAATFTAQTVNSANSWLAGSNAGILVDNDGGASMYTASLFDKDLNGVPRSKVIKLTYNGTTPSNIKIFAVNKGDTNIPYFYRMKIEVGTGGGTFPSTSGFTATATAYDGTLADLVYNHVNFWGGVALTPMSPGQTISLKFTATYDKSLLSWTPVFAEARADFTFFDGAYVPVENGPTTTSTGNSWNPLL
jgi:signal peptidase